MEALLSMEMEASPLSVLMPLPVATPKHKHKSAADSASLATPPEVEAEVEVELEAEAEHDADLLDLFLQTDAPWLPSPMEDVPLPALVTDAASASASASDAASVASSSSSSSPPASKAKAKLTSRERRERHREVVRRSYHRNKQTLSELQETVGALEDQFHALTVARHPSDVTTEVAQAEAQRLNELKEQCQTLNAKSEELRREGVRLQGLLLRYEEFARVVRECAEEDAGADDDALFMEEDGSKPKSGCKLCRQCDTCGITERYVPAPVSMEARKTIGYKPLTDAAAAALVTETYQGIRTFTLSGRTVTTGAKVMGWEDKRMVDGSEVRFSLRKLFQGRSSLDFMSRTWQCLSDPGCAEEKFHGLMQLRILQRFNDDTLIALRDVVSADNTTVYRCVYLLFRIRTDNGFLICTRSLDNLELDKPKCQVARKCRVITWINMFGWFMFDQVEPKADYRDAGVRVEYGGLIDYRDVMQVSTLVLDTLSTVLRWETFAVGPIFTLPSSSFSF